MRTAQSRAVRSGFVTHVKHTLHAGFSCRVWCRFTLVGDAGLLGMEATALSLSRGQVQQRCYQLSDVPLWGCSGNETEATPFMRWN